MDTTMVGWHTSVKELLTLSDEFFQKHKVFQVFIGSPRSLKVPSFTDLAILLKRYPHLEIVVHTPYVVNLCKNSGDTNYVATLGYTIAVAKELDKLGVKYLVTHIGGRPETMSIKESTVNLLGFCQKFLWSTMDCKIKLCLENDSGSKKGTKMGHLKVLDTVIRKINSDRIRMTFDSEHAYAAGFDISSVGQLEQYKDIIEVVHWNAVPGQVEFGGHLDRHSTTSFYESKIDPISVYNVLYNGRRPFIFEVESPVYVKSNLTYLKEVE